MSNITLKPCPFCGQKAFIQERRYKVDCLDMPVESRYKVICGTCLEFSNTEVEAIDKWNAATD